MSGTLKDEYCRNVAHLHNDRLPAGPGGASIVVTRNRRELSGEIELTAEQVEALRANSLYVQIHSEGNPPGELRGWIFPRAQ